MYFGSSEWKYSSRESLSMLYVPHVSALRAPMSPATVLGGPNSSPSPCPPCA
ncbi:Uncharacterised protein [Mycobacteroides abscessus]|nr:Uncharacterised protein [Mycobacteroides abscessus]